PDGRRRGAAPGRGQAAQADRGRGRRLRQPARRDPAEGHAAAEPARELLARMRPLRAASRLLLATAGPAATGVASDTRPPGQPQISALRAELRLRTSCVPLRSDARAAASGGRLARLLPDF